MLRIVLFALLLIIGQLVIAQTMAPKVSKVETNPKGISSVPSKVSPSGTISQPAPNPTLEPEMVTIEGNVIFNGWEEDTLSSFEMSKYEITVAQYRAYCAATATEMPEPPSWGWHENDPIVNVYYTDAASYCIWLSEKTGKTYRLPTEREWEYAASGGRENKNCTYAGSDDINMVAWYADNSKKHTHPVGSKLPNELGLFDMLGNVSEWCRGWYQSDPAAAINELLYGPRGINPSKRPGGLTRVFRGGSWSDDAWKFPDVPNYRKYWENWEGTKVDWLGFRIMSPDISRNKDEKLHKAAILSTGLDTSFQWTQSYVKEIIASNMISVQGGRFNMGSNDFAPIHNVNVGSFRMCKYEVTVAQYTAYCVATSTEMPTPPSWGWQETHPIVNVSYEDAIGFCAWLSEKNGKAYRLPSEAEWEFAALDGDLYNYYTYSGSDDLSEVGWYDKNSGNQTSAVGIKRPNELGIYDMSGNVLEWCNDWFDDYDGTSNNSLSGSKRVVRGGCFMFPARTCRSVARFSLAPNNRTDVLGFRVASN
ncbi:MAG: formylglycine-generating enzyme family protein [Ferruginibacter sp.]